ncbi:ABC transporter ATP-binding protein [Conexibacter sp. DBS9H8]|uniref:ABC transporter ATP-binding protein n=1 Tax=Conexibacter sp. DBS9H8 TaxID=2937801 RepID=UPI00200C98D6|nr:ABC transporter ATP-binding protein [Conexibacter sp. DBS9H8]
MPVITAIDLVYDYGARRAVDGVSLALERGELVALIGPNGAGKTTLLSMLAGVLAPTTGAAVTHGRVGWVPQIGAVYSRLSVAENLRFFARLEAVPDAEAAVAAMIEQMELGERRAEPVGRLSGGNRQRVNVGIGLLGAPAALLLDEPTAALDPLQRERLWGFIHRFVATGTAVLFSTHDMEEAGQRPDRVLEMVDGRLV